MGLAIISSNNNLRDSLMNILKNHFYRWLLPLLAATFLVPQLSAVSVRDFGAVGNGTQDDTQAFQQAIAAAGSQGGTILVPAGRYLITTNLSVDSSIAFTGSGHEDSVITGGGRRARFMVRHSGTSFRDLGFENLVEPIALVSRSGYSLDDIVIDNCRFENLAVRNRNLGIIGLSGTGSTQRQYPIRNLTVQNSIFRNIDAHAINIRANVQAARILNNEFRDIVNDPNSDSPLGGFAIRLGESSDDAGMTDIFADQGNHLIEGNVIHNLRKHVENGNLIGMLIYGNFSTIQNNVIDGVDGTAQGGDTNAMYIRGAFNEITGNIIRNIRGADDDGALSFKGGLNLGSQYNVASYNLFENIQGMSAVEASTSHLLFSNNEIINASPRGFQQRLGEGLTMRDNTFRNADTDIRAQRGEIVISGNHYVASRIWLSQRRSSPSNRTAVRIEDNLFQWPGSATSLIRFANEVSDQFISIRNNRFEYLHSNHGSGSVVNLVANGSVQQVEVIGNHVVQNNSGTLGYTLSSPTETVSNNTFDFNANYTEDEGPGNPPGEVEPPDEEDPPEEPEPVGLIAHYPLSEGSGSTASDHAEFGASLDLAISGGATWLDGKGIAFDGEAAMARSSGGAAKVADQITQTGQFTIDLWAKPTLSNQDGPARLLTISDGISTRNLTLGQGGPSGSDFVVRLRTTNTGDGNGLPETILDSGIDQTIAHYAVTFDGSSLKVYVNGELVQTETRNGALSNWNSGFPLVLGNEDSGDRGWAGELYEVSIFDQSLSDSEIGERYQSGLESGMTPDAPVVSPTDLVFTLNAGSRSASWTGQVGQLYQLQYSSDLKSWSNYGEPFAGDGETISVTDLPNGTGGAIFFRLLIRNGND